MSNEIIKSEGNKILSFEEFKERVLEHDVDYNLFNWAAKQYGRIPSAIRTLINFDPSGISSAIDQLFSEKISDREQENILRVFCLLLTRIWKTESKK